MKSLLENSKYPLSHSGVAHDENPPGRGSGRYPWGSGKRPFQSLKDDSFLGKSRDQDITIKKGTNSYRMQMDPHLGKDGQTYVSLLKSDHAIYAGAATEADAGVAVRFDYEGDNGNDRRPYSIEAKFNKDIVIPSYNTSLNAFLDTIGVLGKNVDLGYNKDQEKRLKKALKMKSEEIVQDAYIDFIGRMMNDTNARSTFISILEDQGYNAIIDDWDHRLGRSDSTFTQTPLIVFDKKNLTETSSFAISKEDAQALNDYYWLAPWDSNASEEEIKEANRWLQRTDFYRQRIKGGA